MALSFGLVSMTWPSDINGWHDYIGGTTMSIRWSYALWSGTTSEMDQQGAKMYFRMYNAAGQFISLGSAYLSKKYHDYNPNLMIGSPFVRFKYVWTNNNVAPTEAEWAAASYTTINIVAPPAPNKPVVTAPATGTELYVNADLEVTWNYSDPKNLEQYMRRILLVDDAGTSRTILSDTSGLKTFKIPAGTISLAAGVRKKYFTLYVLTANGFNPAYTQSDGVVVGYKATSPDKPVPSKPAANAISYPLTTLDVEFGYTAHGGYELAQVVIEYYKEGETAWGRRLTFNTDEAEIQLPANTFTVGTWFWRVYAVNSAGETSVASDSRRLTMAASAPLTPVLTAPEAGSILYNHVSVAYEWTYRNNAGVDQGAAQLQYRRSTEQTWVTVDIVGTQDTAYVEHGAVDASIVWRVRTKNELDEWSPWSETSSYTLATPLPVCSAGAPLSGYVNPDLEQVFSWVANSPIGAAIAAYELRYKAASAGSWTTLTGGSVTSRTLPAGSLPEVEKVSWQVRVRDASNRWSAWTPAIEITTADVPPNAPTLKSPVDVYLSVSEAIRFNWAHNSPIGTAQGGAEVRYQQDGVWTIVSVDGDATALQIAAFSLAAGACLWQARTKNTDGIAGEWSPVASFTLVGAAVTPTILSAAANGARPSIRWTAPGQIVYEVQAWQNSAMIGHAIAAAEAEDGAYRMPDFTPPGMVTLKVRNQNAFGYWSDWAQATVLAAAGTGATPAISAAATMDGLAIDLNLDYDWTAGNRVALYRNGKPVAMMDANGYTDYTARSGERYRYMARAIHADGTYMDSNELTGSVALPCATIAPAASPQDLVTVRINMDDGPEYGRQTDTDCEQVTVAGRELPVTLYGEHRTVAFSLRAAMAQPDFERLNALKTANAPVLYRDAYGRRDYCRLASVIDYGAVRGRWKTYLLVSIALDAMDYDDSISIE